MSSPTTTPTDRALPTFAYVGCYTTKQRNGRGEGIEVYRIDPRTGDWTHVQTLADLVNPSFLALDGRRRFLYAAHGDRSEATAFEIDKQTGELALLNRQPTGGQNGVRLAVDPTNRFVVLANYTSGAVAVLPIAPNGWLAPPSDVRGLSGTPGPHRTEQTSSHPHDIVFDPRGRLIAVPDKGLDAIFVYTLDAARGTLSASDPPSVPTRPGAGPRHIAFHPSQPYAYVINELDCTIATYRVDPERGTLTPRRIVSTLPPGFTGASTTAEIAVAPSGRFVYGSNRGHDSVIVLAVDEATGVLAPVGWQPTQGTTPRFFAIEPSGTFLYAANQDSDTIVAFRLDQRIGALTPTGHVVKTGSPSSIVFR